MTHFMPEYLKESGQTGSNEMALICRNCWSTGAKQSQLLLSGRRNRDSWQTDQNKKQQNWTRNWTKTNSQIISSKTVVTLLYIAYSVRDN